MKLNFSDVVDKHKNVPCVIGCHGPSLNKDRDQIEKLQREGKLIRLSTNRWYEYFNTPPDYWILSNNETNIENQYHIMNEIKCPVFYADTVDLVPPHFAEDKLKVDYLPYDQRHFRGHSCIDIFNNFKKHYEGNQNFDFEEYGGNKVMWRPPRCFENFAGFEPMGDCCSRIDGNRATIQEMVQEVSGHSQHCSTGDTTAMEMIMFAILFGCSPIYIAGMDLDYSLGYATADGGVRPREEEYAFAKVRPNLYNDLKVLNESASMRGSQIIKLK